MVAAGSAWLRWIGREDVEPPTIMHAQNNPGVAQRKNLACPAGYHRVKDLFEESDGTKQDGYVRDGDHVGVSIDYLLPGEGCHIEFAVPIQFDRKKE